MAEPPTGLWTMVKCLDCGIIFLSPRPVPETIKKAYSNYYTHTSDKGDLVNGRVRAVKENLAGIYYAAESGKGSLLNNIVRVILRIIAPLSLYLDAKSRHIFMLNVKPGKLLDIGCGNGEFLKLADSYGWSVVGVDFDENAVREARSGGFDVRIGGVEAVADWEKFDFISLSHVIEHVYDPVALINSCYALLNNGGILWLETPNAESIGRHIYKSSWKGLEPPRHIMLFNRPSLERLLLDAGFIKVEQKSHGLSGLYMGLASESLLENSFPCHSIIARVKRSLAKLFRVIFLEIMQLISKQKREFLTFVAKR
jgi:2-polyprenyl-3-methyl-5-hydroxy-6-metoxy-1,4-benzoquinol methylase